MSDENFTVIIDTREQHPWTFKHFATANKKLDTGDYSIEGLEHILCIERKNSVSEIASNISEKRFKDVIQRMTQYKHAFILIEDSYSNLMNYPIGSDIPKKMWDKIKISPAFILKFLTELSIKYNIHVIFCESPSWAEKTAASIMRRIYEQYGNNKT